ncbi:MAG: DUF4012 domain-containing protein [Bacteroidales bacterium]|nr:DUF4012 domain-containing protein [Bacteroidales bacterium]
MAINILETLLSKNCSVNIVSNDVEKWKQNTEHLSTVSRFGFTNYKEYKNVKNFSYAVFCGGFIDKNNALDEFKVFISNKNFGTSKTLAIFPFETFSLKNSSLINISDNAGIVYVGDLLGPRIDLESNLFLPSLINQIIIKRNLTLAVGEIFYPLFVSDVSKTLVKWLLSFGPYGKETFLLGQQVSSTDFWKKNKNAVQDLRVTYNTEMETRYIPKGYEKIYISSNLSVCFNEMYGWIARGINTQPKAKTPVKNKEKIVKNNLTKKYMRPVVAPLLAVLLFPIITTILGSLFLFMSYKSFMSSSDIGSAQNIALIAKTTFVVGKGESDIIKNIPLLGKFYQETSYISYVGQTASEIMVQVMPTTEDGHKILSGFLDNGVYDIKPSATNIKNTLTYLSEKISYFQLLTKNLADKDTLSAKQILKMVDIDNIKNISKQSALLAGEIPSIFGVDETKNYLILFQNNMELRPTGGFIGSYGIANIGNGKLNGLTINDIYSADGQLKGHVEPPSPIKNYLNEANWWFRDSNWNPDFPTSAERAEWFFNKEMNQQVDGVVAFDLEPIKEILKYTGPIFLADYNLTITPENLYEKTQEEAQANTFPGSRQKASFLTALSRSLISEVSKMSSKNKLMVLKVMFESLEQRHIQIYLHDKTPSLALENMGWDGRIKLYTCGEDCFTDFFGDVEANVGVNKSNYFVKRSMVFNVNFSDEYVYRILKIHYQNTANPSLGPSGIYKNYFRVMIPPDAEVVGSKTVYGNREEFLSPEITQEKGRQEVGALIKVDPSQSKEVVLEWRSPVNKNYDSYGLYIRKQAGVSDDPIDIGFSGKPYTLSNPTFTLTGSGVSTYNTILSKDFFARVSW